MTDDAPALPLPGATLAGRYVLGKPLGKGAMGVVYDGELIRLEQRVAIKILRPEILAEPELVSRFDREARLIAKMKSEHVVRVLDVDITSDGLPFLVMEKLDGRDLGSELKARRSLPVSEAVEYVRQICSGIAEAHRAGIIHRDLKPSNIFLVRRDGGTDADPRRVKILDFGVSKLTSDTSLTATESTLGTPRYMSPEQIRSAKSVDERTDVWSIAVILFELLSGKTPFAGDSATGMAAAIVVDQPLALRSLRPDVPEALERVVMAGLTKNPAERIPSVGVLRDALEPFGKLDSAAATASTSGTHALTGLQPPPPPPSQSGLSASGSSMAQAFASAPVPVVAQSVVSGSVLPTDPPVPSLSVPPGPTQASWAQAPAGGAQPLPMRTIVTLFLVLFVGTAAALLTGLWLTRKPAPSSAAPPGTAVDGAAVPRPPSTVRVGSPAEASASTTTPVDSASSPRPNGSAPAAQSNPVASGGPVARPGPSPQASSQTTPPQTTPPQTTPPQTTPPQTTPPQTTPQTPQTTPQTASSGTKSTQPKDCPTSQKILVGSKLVCP